MQQKTVEETKKYHLVITSSDSYKDIIAYQ